MRVDGQLYEGVKLTPVAARRWTPARIDALTVTDFEDLLDLDPAPEFVLLGTGPTMIFPPRMLVSHLDQRGIGLEAMDSRAAARTWGMLRSEGRWIVAAIMPL